MDNYLLLHLPSRRILTPQEIRDFVSKFGEHGRLLFPEPIGFAVSQEAPDFRVGPREYRVHEILTSLDFMILPMMPQDVLHELEHIISTASVSFLRKFFIDVVTKFRLEAIKDAARDRLAQRLKLIIEQIQRGIEEED